MTHGHTEGGCCSHDHPHDQADHDHHGAASDGGGGCCSGKPASQCCKTKPQHLTAELTREQMEALDPVQLVQRYRRGIEVIDRRVLSLDERRLDDAFLPEAGVGLWPVRVLLGHCVDAELAFVQRMRRAIGETSPVVEAWDEDSFVESGMYGNGTKEYAQDPEADHARVMHAIGGYLAVLHTLRQWHAAWLMLLTPEAWNRTIMHPQRGALTVRQLLSYATWHLEHHGRFLTRKLDKMGLAQPEHSQGGCGCGH